MKAYVSEDKSHIIIDMEGEEFELKVHPKTGIYIPEYLAINYTIIDLNKKCQDCGKQGEYYCLESIGHDKEGTRFILCNECHKERFGK